jgi:hypothetical protein
MYIYKEVYADIAMLVTVPMAPSYYVQAFADSVLFGKEIIEDYRKDIRIRLTARVMKRIPMKKTPKNRMPGKPMMKRLPEKKALRNRMPGKPMMKRLPGKKTPRNRLPGKPMMKRLPRKKTPGKRKPLRKSMRKRPC